MSDYTPIDCGLYSEYELAILRRWRLRISWHDERGIAHMEVVLPVDLQTRAGVEYLIVHDRRGSSRRLRLDKIVAAQRLETG